jgi:UDP-N-acetylglucosamine/UDP-N-acetylgalactosamine diphosphorylase
LCRWHLAKKPIPVFDEKTGSVVTPSSPNGYKLELFSFDIFGHVSSSSKMKALEVVRSEEFSPLKNSENDPTDNPITCRNHVSALHRKWIEKAGGKILNTGKIFP